MNDEKTNGPPRGTEANRYKSLSGADAYRPRFSHICSLTSSLSWAAPANNASLRAARPWKKARSNSKGRPISKKNKKKGLYENCRSKSLLRSI